MEIFVPLFIKLIPLYVFILLGFIAGKYLDVKKESIATLVIYLVAPVIFFNGVYTTHISLSSASLPFLIFAICCLICFVFLFIGSAFWKDERKNVLALISSDGNTGYFGIPIALILFPPHLAGLYIFAGLGVVLYESTLGFFIAARGQRTIGESLKKLLQLPLIYAILLGLALNLAGVHFGAGYADLVTTFKGAYTILGMMIIGLGIAGLSEYKFDFVFTGLAFLAKFLVWPLLIFAVILIDSHIFKFYNADIYKLLILISVVPVAANTVAIATLLKSQPEKVSLTVLLSTLFALFYVPFAVTFFIK